MNETIALRIFMRNNIPFKALKKAGFFSPEIKSTDYEAQAKRVCEFFGLKNIYDYVSMGKGAKVHLTEGDNSDPFWPFTPFAFTVKDRFGENITNIFEKNFR